MTVRIDQLKPGTVVVLGFKHYDETALFLRVEGEGEERQAHFLSLGSDDKTTYEWEAYRMGGRWVYGSSGDRLTAREIVARLGMQVYAS